MELTRINWCPDPSARTTGKVTVRIGPVGIGPDNQPRIERVTETRRFLVPDCEAKGTTLSPPDEPWRMEIAVSPTFVPREIDPIGSSDNRHLGAVIERAGFRPSVRRLARRRDEVREARAEREPRERPAALERLRDGEHRAGQRDGLRDEERSQRDRR